MSEVNVYDMYLHQGETWSTVLEILDDDEMPQDITGYGVLFQAREDFESNDVLLQMSTTNSSASVTGTSGQITLSLASSITKTLTFRQAVYDLFIKSASGTVTYLLKGTFHIQRNVARE